MTSVGVSRRTVLRAGAGIAGAGLFGAGALGWTTAAGAAVPASQRFDLSQPSYDLFRNKPLHESHHIMQGFTFDNVNRRLFVVQAQNGTTGTDLCVNQLDFAGNRIGYMHLNHAGHGVSIGVEPVGSSSYIWMECDADGTTTSARGTALARFKFVSGQTPVLTKYLTGSTAITCATDPINHRLLVRRSEGGAMWWSLFDLADATAGDFSSPLVHVPQPVVSGTVFQGYTVLGSYAYMLDGTAIEDPGSDYQNINSYVTSVDLNTGQIVQRSRTLAGKTLVYREPEGLAIYRTAAGESRLFLGFGSRTTWAGPDDFANLFYKNVLVS